MKDSVGVAIVTGGTKGIGLAIAQALLARGTRVCISSRNQEHVRAATSALESSADREGSVLGVECDVRRYQDCRRMVAATVDAFGRLDVLVNNAGIGAYGPAGELSVEDWDAVIGTNLNGMFYCTHEAIPHLRKAGGGWIINIGSLAGKNAYAGGTAYNASKFGLIGFSEALMQDLRYEDIRVSYIMPGSVATEFGRGSASSGSGWKIQPEDIAQIVTDLLDFPDRTLPSRIEVRPSRPPKR